jgi:hypothetical protein
LNTRVHVRVRTRVHVYVLASTRGSCKAYQWYSVRRNRGSGVGGRVAAAAPSRKARQRRAASHSGRQASAGLQPRPRGCGHRRPVAGVVQGPRQGPPRKVRATCHVLEGGRRHIGMGVESTRRPPHERIRENHATTSAKKTLRALTLLGGGPKQ